MGIRELKQRVSDNHTRLFQKKNGDQSRIFQEQAAASTSRTLLSNHGGNAPPISPQNYDVAGKMYTIVGTASLHDLLATNQNYIPAHPGADRKKLPPRHNGPEAQNNRLVFLGSHDAPNALLGELQMGKVLGTDGRQDIKQVPDFVHINGPIHPDERPLWRGMSREVAIAPFGRLPLCDTNPPTFGNHTADLPHYDSLP